MHPNFSVRRNHGCYLVKLLVETNKTKRKDMKIKQISRTVSVAVASLSLAGFPAHASSHREAP
jgi:hypothetical protein